MTFQEKQKGMWKRTFNIFKKFKIPWHLYILSAILGLVSTKILLMIVPLQADIKLGKITEHGVVTGYLLLTLGSFLVSVLCRIPEFYAEFSVRKNLQTKMIGKLLALPMKVFEKQGSIIINWITQDSDYANGAITTIVGFFTGIVTSIMTLSEMKKIDDTLMFILPVVIAYTCLSSWIEGKIIFLRERRGRKANAQITAFFAEHLSFFLKYKTTSC